MCIHVLLCRNSGSSICLICQQSNNIAQEPCQYRMQYLSSKKMVVEYQDLLGKQGLPEQQFVVVQAKVLADLVLSIPRCP